mgnify:CR=1 FL=1
MKIIDFLKDCQLDNSEMTEFKQIHPKQLISEEIPISIWKIHYSYCTLRENFKKAYKYILDNENAWDRIEDIFMDYIKEFNEKYPERQLLNVKILDSYFMGKIYLKLE